MSKPRLGIVLTEFGIPSEIWALRQAEAFKRFEPVYFAFSHRAGGLVVPSGRELHLFAPTIPHVPDLRRRIQRRIGLADGGLPAPPLLAAARRVLRSVPVDALLCHFAWNAVAMQVAAGDFRPIFCYVHGRDITAHISSASNRRALARALPQFAHTFIVGSHQRTRIEALYPNLRTSLVPCGAPTAIFSGRELPKREARTPVVFVTVGRISEEKGQIQSLAAFESVCRAGIDARLVVIGDGPAMTELRSAVAASTAVKRVRLAGMMAPEAIARELSQAHVFLQHSRPARGWVEGFGVTLTEAGLAGLAIVASDQGGIPDQVTHGVNGFLHAADDISAQADAMSRLANDEGLRRQMGKAARTRAFDFDSTRMAQRLEHSIAHELEYSK